MRRCTKCNQDKPESEFWKRNHQRMHWWCKDCTSKRRHELRRETKRKVIELLGGKCKCGHTSETGASLSVHHNGKKSSSAANLYQWKWERVLKEIEEGCCELLCMNCHMELEYEKNNGR